MATNIGTVPKNIFSLKDVSNVVEYNNLVDCITNATGNFPFGIHDTGSLKYFDGYYENYWDFGSPGISASIKVEPCEYNKILVLFITVPGGAYRTISAPTLEGYTFTQLGSNNGTNKVEIWYLAGVVSGTYTLTINSSVMVTAILNTVPYTENTITPYGNNFTSGSGTSGSISQTSPSSGKIIILYCFIIDSWTSGSTNFSPSYWMGRNAFLDGVSHTISSFAADYITSTSSNQVFSFTSTFTGAWQMCSACLTLT